MENPCLTFATPSLIAGDKSLASVIAHEISHSWSGNLVTMRTWTDFWLNEGFTMFLQRKIDEEMFGVDVAKVSSQIGYFSLKETIATFGYSHDYTTLQPYLVGVNPDDAFSEVPYEKGYNFLYFLEQLINGEAKEDLFKIILRRYFEFFRYKTVSTKEFREFLEQQLEAEFGKDKAVQIAFKINWQNWLSEPGLPLAVNDFSSPASQICDEYLTKLMNGGKMTDFDVVFKSWHEYQREYFLKLVISQPNANQLTDDQYAVFNTILNLGEGWNSEITHMFLTLMLLNKKTDDASLAVLEAFLAKYGRMKFIRPLYNSLATINKAKAIEIFNKYKSFYHPIAVRLIELDFSKII
jgi:leukotriene-A4 hydrolase